MSKGARKNPFEVTDAEVVENFEHIYEQATLAMAKGHTQTVFTVETKSFLALLDEIKNRRPRNISYLLADERISRMDDLIDRLHEEVSYMIANGPADNVSSRFDPEREPPKRRYPVSASLARNIKGEA